MAPPPPPGPPPQPRVANFTGGSLAVHREDGTRLFGMDAELYRKAQAARDPEWEAALLRWVADAAAAAPVAGAQSAQGEAATPPVLADPTSAWKSLRSGVLLCRLANAIEPASVKKIDLRDLPIVHNANIQMYLKACWNLGVPSSDMFACSDLGNAKDMRAVIQNIFSVSRLAQARPKWAGPRFTARPRGRKVELTTAAAAAAASPSTARRWAPVQTSAAPVSTEQIEQAEAEAAAAAAAAGAVPCPGCGTAVGAAVKFCTSCGAKMVSPLQGQLEKEEALRRNAEEEAAAAARRTADLGAELERVRAECESERKLRHAADQALAARTASVEELTAAVARAETEVERARAAAKAASEEAAESAASAASGAAPNAAEPDAAHRRDLAALEDALRRERAERAALQAQLETAAGLAREKAPAAEAAAAAQDAALAAMREELRTLREAAAEARTAGARAEEARRSAVQRALLERRAREEWAERYQDLAQRHKEAALAAPGAFEEEDASRREHYRRTMILSAEDSTWLADGVGMLLSSERHELPKETVRRAQDLLHTEHGRRVFARALGAAVRNPARSKRLHAGNFALLLDLVNECLHRGELGDAPDYGAAKRLLSAASNLSCDAFAAGGTAPLFLNEEATFRAHSVWKNPRFWTASFDIDLFKKQKRYYSAETLVDADFFTTLCCSYMLNMLHSWNLPGGFVEKWVRMMVQNNTRSLANAGAIETTVRSFLQRTLGGKDEPPAAAAAADTGSSARPRSMSASSSVLPTSRPDEAGASAGAGRSYLFEPVTSVSGTLRGAFSRAIPIPPGQTVKQGLLTKKGGRRKNWLPRWFVLKHEWLVYLRSVNETRALGVIHLDGALVTPFATRSGNRHCFLVSSRSDNRDYLFCAASNIEMNEWISAIQGCTINQDADVDAPAAAPAAAAARVAPASLAGASGASGGSTPAAGGGGAAAAAPPPAAAASPAAAAAAVTPAAPAAATTAPRRRGDVVVVVADYTPADPRVELTLHVGDRVRVIKRDPSGWWAGELNLKKGWFSKEYVGEE